MIKAKLISGAVGLILTAGVGYYVVSLIGKNAVLESTLESTVTAMADYATETQTEITAWSESLEVVSALYQDSRNERNETIRGISNADINAMAESDPDALGQLSADLINGLLNDLEAISYAATADTDAQPAQTGADGVTEN